MAHGRWLSAVLLAALASSAQAQVPPEQQLGRFLLQIGGLREPAGVTVAGGDLLVAEAGADRIRLFDADGADAGPAIGGSALAAPHGLAAGGDGRVYVADTGHHRVLVLDRAGRPHGHFGGFGREPGRFNRPTAVAAGGSRVYVADTGNDRIQVFDAGGELETVLGGRGTEPGRFRRPIGVAVDGGGNIYVADADNQRIQKLGPTGEVLDAWGGWGSFPGLFADPSGVLFADGALYVADRLNHRIQVFDSGGEFLYQWGLHALIPREGEGKIHYPSALAFDAKRERLIVAEPFENRCQVFGRAGPPDDEAPAVPRPPRGVQSHFGRLLSVGGDLLAVWEPESRAVLVFHLGQEEPIVITKIGEYGTRFGQFGRISALHVDRGSSTVYVADAANDRLQTFRLDFGEDWRLRFDRGLGRFVRGVDLRRVARSLDPDDPDARLEPVAMTGDGEENLYLLDAHSGRVIVLDAEWNVVRAWGGYGGASPRLLNPVALALGDDRVYVADAWARCVHVFDRAGAHLASLDGGGALVEPVAVAAGSGGGIYVADAGADRVVVLDESGGVLAAFGTTGVEHGELWMPHGVAWGPRGRLFVLDYGNHRGQIFSPDGQWLVTFSAASSYTRARRDRR